MAKYEPLRAFLAARSDSEVPMSFEDIERLIGAPLPPVAFRQRAWWSNNPSNSVMTKAWLEAGYRTERVDMGSHKLVFRRAGAKHGPSETGSPGSPEAPKTGWLERLQARMAGTVQVEPGWDLTSPTGEVWEAERE